MAKRIVYPIKARQDRLYGVWRLMQERCYAEYSNRYSNYGARGIQMCDEWLGANGFLNFKAWALRNGYDYNAPRGACTIDRINNDGNYEPKNCRWVDNRTQTNNRSTNHLLMYNGEIHTLSEWSEITGIKQSTLQSRTTKGWTVEEILFRKVTANGK